MKSAWGLLLFVPALSAADWSWQPALEWRVDNQSNRQLSPQNSGATQAGWLSFDTTLTRATPGMQWSLHPNARLQRSVGDTRLDFTDESLQLNGFWQREYSQFSFTADASRENTLTTELAETGIVDFNTRRDLLNGSLAWSLSFTPHTQLQTQLGYQDVDYPDGLRLGLTGYRYPNASLSFVHQLSSYTSWNLQAFGGRLESPLTLTTSRDTGLRTGITRQLSPAMQLELSIGASQTQISNFFGERRDRSNVWEARLTRTGELTQWNFSLERNIAPNGRGVLAQRDEAAISVNRALTSRFTGSLSLHAVQNADRTVTTLGSDDYRYLSAETGLDYKLSQYWKMSARLGDNNAHRRSRDSDANGWYTSLALNWSPALHPIRLGGLR